MAIQFFFVYKLVVTLPKTTLQQTIPCCLVVRIPGIQSGGPGSTPGMGMELLKFVHLWVLAIILLRKIQFLSDHQNLSAQLFAIEIIRSNLVFYVMYIYLINDKNVNVNPMHLIHIKIFCFKIIIRIYFRHQFILCIAVPISLKIYFLSFFSILISLCVCLSVPVID